MSLVQGQDAPWYEQSGLTRCVHETLGFKYISGNGTAIVLPFSFPIGSDTANKIIIDWGEIKIPIDNVRDNYYDGSYTDRIYYVNLSLFGWGNCKVSYEVNSRYCRVVFDVTQEWRTGKKEVIFFSNGNIQYKLNYPSSLSYGTSILYHRYVGDTAEDVYLVNDSTNVTDNESVFIQRVSSYDYQVYHHSYYANDSTYTVPLSEKIIGNIRIKGNSYTVGDSTLIRQYSIPIYSETGIGSRSKKFRICPKSGVNGYVELLSPTTPDGKHPPAYIEIDNGVNKQLGMGVGSSVQVYDEVSMGDWLHLSGNLYPPNTGSYYWIGSSYRAFERAISGVTGIICTWGFDGSSNTNSMAYFYTGSRPDITTTSELTNIGNDNVDYKTEGYCKTTEITFSSRTVGGLIVLPGITGRNANTGPITLYNVYVKTNSGWVQI